MRLKEVIDNLNKSSNNDFSRPLLESIVAPEVQSALKKWIKNAKDSGVLIGGLALSFHGKPRQTMDVDVAYVTPNEIPGNVPGFKRIRQHSYMDLDTHVEIEVLDPQFMKVPPNLVKKVRDTAIISNGMKVASKSGVVAIKLGRAERENNLQDQADIQHLIKTGNVDVSEFKDVLTSGQINLFNKIYHSTL